jgi:GNAT superfamily N-acetyltransferase
MLQISLALDALHEPLAFWIHYNDPAAKRDLLERYEALPARQRAALEQAVEQVFPGPTLTAYRRTKPGDQGVGGMSLSTDRPAYMTTFETFELRPEDVLIHWAVTYPNGDTTALGGKGFGHEHEVILRPGARPRRVGGEMRESGPSDDPRKWAALDDSLRDSLRRAQKSKSFNGYEMYWLPHKGGDATILAVDGNKVVGSLFYGKERPSDETLKGAIEVRPEYRRQGIATELYVWAEQLSGLGFLPDEPHTEAAQALWGQKSRPFGMRETDPLKSLIASTDARYPRAGEYVDGRLVRDHVPNRDSIEGYMGEQEELPGIRVVPMSDFGNPRSVFYAADDFERSERLAELIGRSGEISPLIIGIDEKGPFIIEGAHRFVALWHLKAREFPAVVVVGRD